MHDSILKTRVEKNKKNHEKRIIVFVQHMTDGGAERVLSELITYWRARDVYVIIVEIEPDTFSDGYQIPSDIEIIKVKTHKGRVLKNLQSIFSMIRIMRTYADIPVIAFNKVVIYKLAIARLFVKNRIILSERNDPYSNPESKWRRWFRDWAFQHADICVFQTQGAMDYFPNSVKRKGVIIPNPINPDLPERYEGIREKKIVTAGRLTSQKNFQMLITAFAMLHQDFPDYQLVIYGRGELKDELEELAQNLHVSDFVIFPGFSENIFVDMRKCALYVSSSNYEGISNSMLEALALGIPSVVTDCPPGGARMVIRDHENGILVPVGDTKAMSDAMRELLSTPLLAEALGKQAYRIREDYPIEKVAEKWIELFQ